MNRLVQNQIPWELRRRMRPSLQQKDVQRAIAYERALAPIPIAQDAFDQLLYDTVAADPRTPRALILERMNRRYRVTS